MVVELKSDWMIKEIDLMKIIHGYEREGINEEIGSIDYVSRNDKVENRLLKAIPIPAPNPSKVNKETATKIVESLKHKNYNEVVILAEDLTESAKSLLREENIDYVTPDKKHHYTFFELIEAIHKVTQELCKAKCGKMPTKKEDCKGYQPKAIQEGHASRYTCQVRRMSDNADFHAKNRWQDLVKKDFIELLEIRREMDEQEDD